MTVIMLLLCLLLGGCLCWYLQRFNPFLPRWAALFSLILACLLCIEATNLFFTNERVWLFLHQGPWIPRFGIEILLAIDGISLLLIWLTIALGFVALVSAWHEITDREGFFYFNFLWVIAGVIGIFTALDLFLFFFFWEVMLIPMFFIISIWGHENRHYAAIKFFIFTQASGLLMLLSIVVLGFFHYKTTGSVSFNYFSILDLSLPRHYQHWLFLGFFIPFAVKLPSIPFHSWLPDAHTQAPTAGSILLAGILLKTGAYGLLRFVLPLFPLASYDFAQVIMCIGMLSVLYGALMAFSQTDIKRIIAYSSISHMGFITLGVFANTTNALHGAVVTMLAHGFSSAALFALAGAIQHRIHTRELSNMGGFWPQAPKLGAIMLFFCLAALGLPGLANFIGEFMVLIGSYSVAPAITIFATFGMIASPIYALWLIQRIFHGKPAKHFSLPDLKYRELPAFAFLIAVTVYLGFYPSAVMDIIDPALANLQSLANTNSVSSILPLQD